MLIQQVLELEADMVAAATEVSLVDGRQSKRSSGLLLLLLLTDRCLNNRNTLLRRPLWLQP